MNLFFIFAAEEGGHHDLSHSLHWLWPAKAELIFGTISSLLVFGVLIYLLRKPVANYFAGRTESIQADLDNAETQKAEAEAEATKIRSAAGDIDAERRRLFEEADAEAEQLLAEGRERLRHEVMELEARADADIEAAAGRANGEIAGEIARLSGRATEAAIAGGVVDEATQQELIEAFIADVGRGVRS